MKPSELLAFKESLNGSKGDLDAWLECNNEAEVREAIKALLAEAHQEIVARCAKVCESLRKDGETWKVYIEGWNDALDIAEQAIRRLAEEQEGKNEYGRT